MTEENKGLMVISGLLGVVLIAAGFAVMPSPLFLIFGFMAGVSFGVAIIIAMTGRLFS